MLEDVEIIGNLLEQLFIVINELLMLKTCQPVQS